MKVLEDAKRAKKACAKLTTEDKNKALAAMADSLIEDSEKIIAANKIDLENAKDKYSSVMLDRLMLSSERVDGLAKGVRDVIELEDPCGRLLEVIQRPNGLKIEKRAVPIGVIAVIYESRPNVTSDVAALALKSGNVCILRSGKEAINSSRAIVSALKKGLAKAGLDQNLINLVDDTSRESANKLMRANDYVDILIPRGGKGLISACVENATVPCIQTGTGICHVYVEKTADIDMAVKIIENAKMSRPSVCNAEEVLLVDKHLASKLLPRIKEVLVDKRIDEGKIPCELRLDEYASNIISGSPAGENDFDTEFLDYILAIRCVDDVFEAVEHISAHSTGHSDAIITNDDAAKQEFILGVDSAAVYINASTRFTDGGEFGLGCEIGISTQKLHARGPMGLRELTTYKYVIYGEGQVR